ncbi:MAG TPA: glycosyltransferase family 4 protein [Bacillota bacterium]|nr:glycosyltransferase family 4 protein [Bacillota bacterium]HPZ54979.1 glycosyltransferase family 4 protein [Bacillota bacterium]
MLNRRFAGRKVLFLATVYSHLAAFHIPYIKLLQQLGCEVHAAASSAEGGMVDVQETGAICWEIPFGRSPYSPGNTKACLLLRRLLSRTHYDLIHVHTPVASFLGRLLARATHQGKTLYTAHGFHFYEGAPLRNWLVYYTAERLAARWTDGLIVMNTEDLENAQRMGFELGKNLFYVHGVGVDLDRYAASSIHENSVRVELGIPTNDLVVTCVAELNRNKNQDYLLDAWRLFSRKFTDAHLLLVGGGDAGALERKVKRERISRVHFLGYRCDVPDILQMTDVAVLVSKREGLPRCLLEAMAAGKPVVASNVRGNRDLVDHEQTGFLVELGDVPGLVCALERLAVDRKLMKEMGLRGREKMRDYSLDKVVGEMARVYCRYLAEEVGRV